LRATSPPGTPGGLTSNFEVKSFDGSANPYLGLAAIVSAGINGLRRHLSLPEPVGKIIQIIPCITTCITNSASLMLLFSVLHDGYILLFRCI